MDVKRPNAIVTLIIGAVLIAGAVAVAFLSGGDTEPAAASPPTTSATPAGQMSGGPPPGTGPAAPGLTFEFFDGSQATFASYSGRPVVVNFWASWCPSCVAEMSAAFKPVQERLGDDVAFVGFNVQDRRSEALRLVDETGVLFDLAEDPVGELYTELGGIAMPFTVFISEHGEIVHEHNGPVTEGQLEDLIRQRLLGA